MIRLLLILPAISLAASVFAAQPPFPSLSGSISVEVETDAIVDANPSAGERTDTYATIEPALKLAINRALSLNAGFVMEPVRDPVDDRFLEDHGLYVEQLYFEWSGDALGVRAGKYNPAFGVAWDLAPGIYGADFAEDYEITEQIGAGATARLGGGHDLTLDVFQADTSALASSVLVDRTRLRRSAGGPGNTGGFDSFTVTVGSDRLDALGGLGYRVGLIRRAGGVGNAGDEFGFAVALTHTVELGGGRAIDVIAEGVHLTDAGAGTNDATYITAGLGFRQAPWNAAVTVAGRHTSVTAGPDVDDTLLQVSGGYGFESGLTLDVGWRYGDEGGATGHTIGAIAAYAFEF